jgi:hypothetical protein
MTAPQQIQDELQELNRRWTEAEIGADVAALDALAADDFVLVGPVGFVVDKQHWLDRYRSHELVTEELAFRATQITVRDGSGWRLAGLHLSPIGGPPPFAGKRE